MYRLYFMLFACLLATVTACAQVESPPAVVSEPTTPAHIEPVSPLPPPTPDPPVPLAELPPPPQCTFDQTVRQSRQQAEPLLEEYVFSEPRQLLDGINHVDIIQWLPDGRRILIALPEGERQVGLYDTQTHLFTEYFRGGIDSFESTVWIESLQGIVFTEFDENGQIQLKLARTADKARRSSAVELLSSDVASLGLAVLPNAQNVSFANGSQTSPIQYVQPTKTARAVQPQPKYRLRSITDAIRFNGQHYLTAWHPDGHQFAYYNSSVFYLGNAQTGEFCELDLGGEEGEGFSKRWALSSVPISDASAKWSSDGRYLAIQTTTSFDLPVTNAELAILDHWTGELKFVQIEDFSMFIMFAWAPSGRELFVSASKIAYDPDYQVIRGNYFFNVLTGSHKQLFLDNEIEISSMEGAEWSPRGDQFAATCSLPEPTSFGLCLFDVEVKR